MKYQYKGAKGLPAISKMTGVSARALEYRINARGMTVGEAIRHDGARYDSLQYQYQGYVGVKAIADAFGIKHSMLFRRIKYMGLSVEEAVMYKYNSKKMSHAETKAQINDAIKSPCALSDTWKLALGMGGWS